MKKILIIDDEAPIQAVLSDILEDENLETFTADNGPEGLEILKSEPIDLIFLDVWMPQMGGIEVLEIIKKEYPVIEVVVVSGHANIDIAVKAIKMGALDFLEKPLDLNRVLAITEKARSLFKLKDENRRLKKELRRDHPIIGSTEEITKILSIIDQSAASESRIMISGENGTGKELVARKIHYNSTRADGPFIEVNCAAIPDNLIESELFGHEKGAFTGAVSQRKGKFELANGGTIFLDEVADLSLNAQAKMLRAIQELRFERVGGEESISVDIRIITATNKDIPTEIKDGNFREDLYFRLNVIPIHVPPLRDRVADLPELINHFGAQYNNNPDNPRSFSLEAISAMTSYSWPGNIRELKNFIERVLIMNNEQVIGEEIVKESLGASTISSNQDSFLEPFEDLKLNDAKELFEKSLLIDKLNKNGYNISKTAEILGIYPSNLHGKMKKFGIQGKK